MIYSRQFFMRSSVVVLCALLLGGCAVTDRYAGRSQAFNQEADDFYNNMIWSNIIRASFNAPMQFSELQSVTGQTTSSGSISFDSPVGGFPYNTPRMIHPSVGGSTQTLFTAAVQNSQEFYQGVSAPLSPVQASYFVRTVGPKELLYGMLFGSVTLYRDDGICSEPKKRYLEQCTLAFQNNPSDPQNSILFQATMEYLIRLGFSMDTVEFINRDRTYEFKDGGKKRETKDERKDDSVKQVARYCFRPRFMNEDALISNADFVCGRKTTLDFFERAENSDDQSPALRLDTRFIWRLRTILKSYQRAYDSRGSDPDDDPGRILQFLNDFDGKSVRIELTTRSTIDVFNYLGAVIRQQRKPEGRVVLIRSNIIKDQNELPCDFESVDGCGPLMLLADGSESTGIEAEYNGRSYRLAIDPAKSTYGLYALSIVKRILGLNTASKNTPAPVILTSSAPP